MAPDLVPGSSGLVPGGSDAAGDALAGALYMAGRGESALAIWISLLNRELEEVAHGEHGEGMDWALQLMNDVQYRIGRYYQGIGRDDFALASFKKISA